MPQKITRKKQIVILRHNGGQLCNQLLLFISVYAFCLEKDFTCINCSFYEYNKYFNFEAPNFYVKLFELISKFKFYKSHAFLYIIYKWSTNLVTFFKKGLIIKSGDTDHILYLPPTIDANPDNILKISQIDLSKHERIYIDGWGFRNPVGLKKYRKEIIQLFKPKKEIIQRSANFIKKFNKGNFLVGVHIRQGEYKSKKFMAGTWYFNEKEVAEILKAYLKKEWRDSTKVIFIVCSDGPLDLSHFKGLNIKMGIGTIMEDLITLSMCDEILGSNSTFGSFAAYFGNIPFFIFDRKKNLVEAKGNNLMQGIS